MQVQNDNRLREGAAEVRQAKAPTPQNTPARGVGKENATSGGAAATKADRHYAEELATSNAQLAAERAATQQAVRRIAELEIQNRAFAAQNLSLGSQYEALSSQIEALQRGGRIEAETAAMIAFLKAEVKQQSESRFVLEEANDKLTTQVAQLKGAASAFVANSVEQETEIRNLLMKTVGYFRRASAALLAVQDEPAAARMHTDVEVLVNSIDSLTMRFQQVQQRAHTSIQTFQDAAANTAPNVVAVAPPAPAAAAPAASAAAPTAAAAPVHSEAHMMEALRALKRRMEDMEGVILSKSDEIRDLQLTNQMLTEQVSAFNTAVQDDAPDASAFTVDTTAIHYVAAEPMRTEAEKYATLQRMIIDRRKSEHSDELDVTGASALNSTVQDDFNANARAFMYRECQGMLSHAYEFVKTISMNPDNAVYKCRQRDNGSLVAVKIVDGPSVPGNESKEVRCLSAVQGCNNVQKLLTWISLPRTNCHAIVTEWVADSDVDHTKPADVRDYMRGVMTAIAHCHARGIISRDIKPDNVLWDAPNRRAVVIDFDCATPHDPAHLPYKRIGTDGYFAPEIDRTDKQINRRRYSFPVDVWSAGVTFAKWLFTREARGKTPRVDFIYELLSRVARPVPAHDLLRRMLEVDPSRRITPAQALQHPYFTGPLVVATPFPEQMVEEINTFGTTFTTFASTAANNVAMVDGSSDDKDVAPVKGAAAAPVNAAAFTGFHPQANPMGARAHRPHYMAAVAQQQQQQQQRGGPYPGAPRGAPMPGPYQGRGRMPGPPQGGHKGGRRM